MIYAEEKFQDWFKDAVPLVVANSKEIDIFGQQLDLDLEAYVSMDMHDLIKSFTVRDDDGKLVGYCLFYIYNHTHFKEMKVAKQDVIYVDPKYRTCGIKLLRYTEKELKSHGIDLIIQAAPKISRLGGVLKRLGYEEMETLYTRRL